VIKEFALEYKWLLTTIFFIVSLTTESIGMVIFTVAFLFTTQAIYWKGYKSVWILEVFPPVALLLMCYIFVFLIWSAFVLENANEYNQKVLETKYYPSTTFCLSKDNQLILKEEDGKIAVEKLNTKETKELLLATFYTDDKSVLVKEKREIRFFNDIFPVRYTKFRFIKQKF
jgi:energy-coupling factor transporter transmembrane protein EcfT